MLNNDSNLIKIYYKCDEGKFCASLDILNYSKINQVNYRRFIKHHHNISTATELRNNIHLFSLVFNASTNSYSLVIEGYASRKIITFILSSIKKYDDLNRIINIGSHNKHYKPVVHIRTTSDFEDFSDEYLIHQVRILNDQRRNLSPSWSDNAIYLEFPLPDSQDNNSWLFASLPFTQHELSKYPEYIPAEYGYMINRFTDDLEEIFKNEKTSLSEFSTRLQFFYDKNKNFKSSKPSESPIPKLHHRIWLTKPSNPKEMPDDYRKMFINSIKYTSNDSGWTNILWVHDKSLIPITTSELMLHNIEVREVYKDLPEGVYNTKGLEESIERGIFASGADQLRADILYQLGGVYMDTDFDLFKNIDELLRFELVAAMEPQGFIIANTVLFSKLKHPFFHLMREYIKRNFDPSTRPQYINDRWNEVFFFTNVATGPTCLSYCFSLELK